MQETPQDGQPDGAGEATEAKPSWWRRLSGGLKRSSSALTAISDLVTKRMLDEAAIEEIHDALVRADLGIGTADRIADTLSRSRHNAPNFYWQFPRGIIRREAVNLKQRRQHRCFPSFARRILNHLQFT